MDFQNRQHNILVGYGDIVIIYSQHHYSYGRSIVIKQLHKYLKREVEPFLEGQLIR
ncbi:hypothetical protein [Gracilibacillus orientalis]|uniref:hypothetical protein n=1 Tax=Gracilibacillus orientalis TaxID=334253 RepID=UPI001C31D435|nr:hypothetical protein [Gracilibacillus orientalis]